MAPTSRGNTATSSASYYSSLGLSEIFADLAARFIINLPASELASIERICFQVEESHWFYSDFIRPIRPDLPNFTLRRFSELFLISCSPHLSAFKFDPKTAYDAFLQYKTSVPVRGAVLLNASLSKVVLVKGWKSSAGWGFPRGKINQDEHDRDCAVREVWEETSYDISPHLDPRRQHYIPTATNDVPPPLSDDVIPETPDDYIELVANDQRVRLYIVTGVSEDAEFTPRTRKEISKIAFFALKDLPGWHGKHGQGHDGENAWSGKFYMVAPVLRCVSILFVKRMLKGRLLKTWIKKRRGKKSARTIEALEVEAEHEAKAESEHANPQQRNELAEDTLEPAAPAFVDAQEATRALQAFFLGSTAPLGGLKESDSKFVVSSGVPQPDAGIAPLQDQHVHRMQPQQNQFDLAGDNKSQQVYQSPAEAQYLPQPNHQAPKQQESQFNDRTLELLNLLNAPLIPDNSPHQSSRATISPPQASPTGLTESQRNEKRHQLLSDLDAVLGPAPLPRMEQHHRQHGFAQPNFAQMMPISQPMAIRPIALLSNFTSPPPGHLPHLHYSQQPAQQQLNLLDLFNAPPRNQPDLNLPMPHL